MPRIDVKAVRDGDGIVISAHTKDWDLLQSFPHAIARDIVDALVTRFIQENGVAIMQIVQDPELLAVALSKEVSYRVHQFIALKKKQELERAARK